MLGAELARHDPLKMAMDGTDAIMDFFKSQRRHNLAAFTTKSGTTLLHASCAGGNEKAVTLCLKHGMDVSARDDKYGLTPVHEAALRGHKNIVRILVDAGANINARSKKGWTPMCYAVMQGNLEMCKFLAQHGANLAVSDKEGLTLSHIAAILGQARVLDFLVKHKVDINVHTTEAERNTPLIFATAYGHTDVARRLIELGADTYACNSMGYTAMTVATTRTLRGLLDPENVAIIEAKIQCPRECPLHLAASRGSVSDMEQYFFGKDRAPPLPVNHTDQSGFTALHITAINGNTECMDYLLRLDAANAAADAETMTKRKGADPLLVDRSGRTCLHLAAGKAHAEAVRLLLDHPAAGRLIQMTAEDGDTPLFSATQTGSLEVVTALLDAKSEVNYCAADTGRSALFAAAQAGHTAVAACLIDRGGHVLARDDAGVTPLHLACGEGHIDTAVALARAGISVNARDHNRMTPLHAAAEYNRKEMGVTLLAMGSDPNARTTAWWTPLHQCASHGHVEFAQALLEWGANSRITTRDGRTCFSLAHANQHYRFEEDTRAFINMLIGKSVSASHQEGGGKSKKASGPQVSPKTAQTISLANVDPPRAFTEEAVVGVVRELVRPLAPNYQFAVKVVPRKKDDGAICVEVVWSRPTPGRPVPLVTSSGRFVASPPAKNGDMPSFAFTLERSDLVQHITATRTALFSEAWLDRASASKLRSRSTASTRG